MSPSIDQRIVHVGTRTSALARRQTDLVVGLLQRAWPELRCQTQLFITTGDRTLDQPLPEIGGKGVFTAELERAYSRGGSISPSTP